MRITCFSSSLDRKMYSAVILRPFTCFMHVGQVIFLSDYKGYISSSLKAFTASSISLGIKEKKKSHAIVWYEVWSQIET